MQILELPEGKVSLEFAPSEANRIQQVLKTFGKVRRRQEGVVHDLLKIGRIELIYYFEWDEPCLISTSPAGSTLLRELAAKSIRSQAA